MRRHDRKAGLAEWPRHQDRLEHLERTAAAITAGTGLCGLVTVVLAAGDGAGTIVATGAAATFALAAVGVAVNELSRRAARRAGSVALALADATGTANSEDRPPTE